MGEKHLKYKVSLLFSSIPGSLTEEKGEGECTGIRVTSKDSLSPNSLAKNEQERGLSGHIVSIRLQMLD